MSTIAHSENKDKAREDAINSEELFQSFDDLWQRLAKARNVIGRFIFGQDDIIEETLITLLAGGHLLLIGVPGLGKTRLVEMLGVVLRGGPRDMAPDPTKTSLSDARAALGAGSAVQLRYRWEGQEWWDTLTPRQSGVVALVRIRHPLGVYGSQAVQGHRP